MIKIIWRILKILILIFIDFSIYIFLLLNLMNYEDFYTIEKGPWYSLQSMNMKEKIVWVAYISWFVINGIMFIYFFIKFLKYLVNEKK